MNGTIIAITGPVSLQPPTFVHTTTPQSQIDEARADGCGAHVFDLDEALSLITTFHELITEARPSLEVSERIELSRRCRMIRFGRE